MLCAPRRGCHRHATALPCKLPSDNPHKSTNSTPAMHEMTSASASLTKHETEELRDSVDFWWHSIDLGQGVVTPGRKPPELLATEWAALQLGDLAGKSVLDIGAWDGYFSFAAERHGAARVVSLDHFVWTLDVAQGWKDWEAGIKHQSGRPEDGPLWRPDLLPGKKGYDAAHRALGSRAEQVVADYLDVDPQALGGPFDVVFYLGVLYHMENPLQAMRKVSSLTAPGGILLIETEALEVHGAEGMRLAEFFPGAELHGDVSNWWAPTQETIVGLCTAAGFSRAEVLVGPPVRTTGLRSRLRDTAEAMGLMTRSPVTRYRCTVKAFK